MSYIFGADTPNENTDTIDGNNIGQLVTAYPFSLAIWCRPNSNTMIDRNQTIVAVCDAITNEANGVTAVREYNTRKVSFRPYDAGATSQYVGPSTGTLDTGAWRLVIITLAGASAAATLYFHNGTSWDSTATTATNARAPTLATMDSIRIGQRANSSTNTGWIGKLAECAIWSGYEITSDDRTALLTTYANALGTTQNAALAAYWPLYNDLNDDVGTKHLTGTGVTADTSDHPALTGGASAVAGISRHYARMMNG